MKRERITKLHDLMETGGIKKGHVVEMLNEIEHLREWIKCEADANDTCTFEVLGEVCDGCRCGKLTPNVEFSGAPAALSPEAPLERRVGPDAQEKTT